jgi:mannose/fructose/N-acetylgalactosamine-specific phosphotransferase system component IIC
MTLLASGAACASGLAALELDAASVGPFLLSRPFVVGPLVGWALGDAWTGAVLAAVFEALTLEELPLGGCLELSASVAAGTAAWLAAGPAALPVEAAFLCGLVAGYAHAAVERRLRRTRGGHARRVEAALEAGRAPGLGAELSAALALQVVATFVVVFVLLSALGPTGARAWAVLPDALRAGARTAFLGAPWLAGGSLAASLVRRA